MTDRTQDEPRILPDHASGPLTVQEQPVPLSEAEVFDLFERHKALIADNAALRGVLHRLRNHVAFAIDIDPKGEGLANEITLILSNLKAGGTD